MSDTTIPCECADDPNVIPPDGEFKQKVLALLCCLNQGDEDEYKILCDNQGGGTVVQFLRHYVEVGPPVDTELDGVTPYVVVGTVEVCAGAANDFEIVGLCDVIPGDPITKVDFLRKISIDPDGLITVTDTELDGVTPYSVLGTVQKCCCEVTVWTETLCYQVGDDPTVAGLYSVNPNTGEIHVKNSSCVDQTTLAAPDPGTPSNGFFGVAVSLDAQTLYATHIESNPHVLRSWDLSIDPFAPVLIGDTQLVGFDITDSAIAALDVNPADGLLYALVYSNNGAPTPQDYKIYEVDPMTGGCILRTTIPTEYNGSRTGFAFDPAGDVWTVTDEGATFKVSQWAFPSGAFINSPYAITSTDVAFIDITSDGTELYAQAGLPSQIDTRPHPAGAPVSICGAAYEGLDLALLPSGPAPQEVKFKRLFVKDLTTGEIVDTQDHDFMTGETIDVLPGPVVECSQNQEVDIGNIVENLQRNDQVYTWYKDDDGAGNITYYWDVKRIDPLSASLIPVGTYTPGFTAFYTPVGASQSPAVEVKAIREDIVGAGPTTFEINDCVKSISVYVRNQADENNPIRIVDADANSSSILSGEEATWSVQGEETHIPALRGGLSIVLPTAGDEVVIVRTELI